MEAVGKQKIALVSPAIVLLDFFVLHVHSMPGR